MNYWAISLASAALFASLLALLHIIKPELDPSWHFISEYEIGSYGWVMQLAFFSLAVANLALLAAVRRYVRGLWGRIGLVLFLVGTAGTVLGGVFVSDPVTESPAIATTSGKLHNLGGTLGLAGVLGTLIISWKLLRSDAWCSARRTVLLATGLFFVGFLVSFVSIAVLVTQHGGVFGPDVPVGWPNRLGTLAGCTWLMLVAWQARHIDVSSNTTARGLSP